jgi:enterochelin esterase-like enzyme
LGNQVATVVDYTVNSSFLGEGRVVSVFLPPDHQTTRRNPVLYCADGQSLQDFASKLERAIRLGHAPSVVVVGVHSHPEYRNREYLAGMDARRFGAHESFFTNEVYQWSHAHFALEPSHRSCGVFGYSCGAAFALAVGTRHPEKYGNVIAFSVAGATDKVDESDYARPMNSRFYMSAGTKEPSFRDRSRAIASVLGARGVNYKYTEKTAGHDPEFWASELPEAIQWCFTGNASE